MKEDLALANPLLAAYQPPPGVYDELRADGAIRPHWRQFFNAFAELPADAVRNLRHTADRILRDYAEIGSPDQSASPWRLDPLPLLLNPAEWQELEEGLLQRARLLNQIVADFYGSQRLLKSGALPPALAYANPHYLLPACGYTPADGNYLKIIAFDLGRAPDGVWRVLSNRTESPTGLGYILQNRIALARAMPELLDRTNITRLARFFRSYNAGVQQLAGGGLAVILTGGPDERGYSEQTFLGQYLGLPVVEGADLTVRAGRVYLKTLEGLKPIRVISRQIGAQWCDPLELRSDSLLGVAGLLQAARSGSVILANAIGSGVVDNDAIMSFLPALAEHYLHEPLKLPTLASWWCGQPEAAAEVLKNADHLVLRRAFDRKTIIDGRVEDHLSGDYDATDRTALERALQIEPYAVVGRQPIALSHTPCLNDKGQIVSAPMTLRLFVAATADGYRVLPGGLVRVALNDGDRSKDLWLTNIFAREPLPPQLSSREARRSDRDLPSRTADDLFWLGRYLERTEGAVRLYRTLFRSLAGEENISDQPVALAQIVGLLVSQGYLSRERARRAAAEGRRAVQRELWTILFDEASEDGLEKLITNVYRTATHVRERLSSDAWRMFERLHEAPRMRFQVHNIADALRLLNELVEKLSAVSGQVYENMTRSYGWRLLELGKRIERTRFSVRTLKYLLTRTEDESIGTLNLLLDICDSTITHQSRYRALPTAETVIDLLLLDGSNPRSVMHQINVMQPHMAVMPLEQRDGSLSDSARVLLAAQNELTLADVEQLAGVISKSGARTRLSRLLQRIEKAVNELTQVITRTYFNHTPRQGR